VVTAGTTAQAVGVLEPVENYPYKVSFRGGQGVGLTIAMIVSSSEHGVKAEADPATGSHSELLTDRVARRLCVLRQ